MPYGPMLTDPRRDVCNLAIGAEVRGAEPSALRPSYHSFGRPIPYRHHHLAKDHHYHLAESSAPRQYKSPPPLGRALSAAANTMGPVVTIGPSRQRRGDINHHHHLAEPSAPMPTPWAESLPLITTTIGPSRQHRGNINHHHHLAEPSAPMPTPWAKPLPLITITIGPTCQCRGQHHGPSHYYQSPLLLGRAISAKANTMGR